MPQATPALLPQNREGMIFTKDEVRSRNLFCINHFLYRDCRFGDNCKYSHDFAPQARECHICCKHHMFSQCRFGNKCRRTHDNSLCNCFEAVQQSYEAMAANNNAHHYSQDPRRGHYTPPIHYNPFISHPSKNNSNAPPTNHPPALDKGANGY